MAIEKDEELFKLQERVEPIDPGTLTTFGNSIKDNLTVFGNRISAIMDGSSDDGWDDKVKTQIKTSMQTIVDAAKEKEKAADHVMGGEGIISTMKYAVNEYKDTFEQYETRLANVPTKTEEYEEDGEKKTRKTQAYKDWEKDIFIFEKAIPELQEQANTWVDQVKAYFSAYDFAKNEVDSNIYKPITDPLVFFGDLKTKYEGDFVEKPLEENEVAKEKEEEKIDETEEAVAAARKKEIESKTNAAIGDLAVEGVDPDSDEFTKKLAEKLKEQGLTETEITAAVEAYTKKRKESRESVDAVAAGKRNEKVVQAVQEVMQDGESLDTEEGEKALRKKLKDAGFTKDQIEEAINNYKNNDPTIVASVTTTPIEDMDGNTIGSEEVKVLTDGTEVVTSVMDDKTGPDDNYYHKTVAINGNTVKETMVTTSKNTGEVITSEETTNKYDGDRITESHTVKTDQTKTVTTDSVYYKGEVATQQVVEKDKAGTYAKSTKTTYDNRGAATKEEEKVHHLDTGYVSTKTTTYHDTGRTVDVTDETNEFTLKKTTVYNTSGDPVEDKERRNYKDGTYIDTTSKMENGVKTTDETRKQNDGSLWKTHTVKRGTKETVDQTATYKDGSTYESHSESNGKVKTETFKQSTAGTDTKEPYYIEGTNRYEDDGLVASSKSKYNANHELELTKDVEISKNGTTTTSTVKYENNKAVKGKCIVVDKDGNEKMQSESMYTYDDDELISELVTGKNSDDTAFVTEHTYTDGKIEKSHTTATRTDGSLEITDREYVDGDKGTYTESGKVMYDTATVEYEKEYQDGYLITKSEKYDNGGYSDYNATYDGEKITDTYEYIELVDENNNSTTIHEIRTEYQYNDKGEVISATVEDKVNNDKVRYYREYIRDARGEIDHVHVVAVYEDGSRREYDEPLSNDNYFI